MLEERVKACKELGANNVSLSVRYEKPVEEMITTAEKDGCDLIVVASSKITSHVRSLCSVARWFRDGTIKPVLIVRE
jgi:nucleotide-binding universal stress UspA family protein